MKQISNGRIVIMCQLSRSVDDTLISPFFSYPLYAPLKFFNILILDPKDGRVIINTSSECPSLTYSNVDKDFIPEVKSITELPNGNLSFCADVYWPLDNIPFYKAQIFSKRAVNFITNSVGIYTDLIIYSLPNGSCSLQSVWETGKPGEQVLLVKDSSNDQLITFGIDENGQVEWTKAFKNPIPTNNSKGVILQKKNTNGFSIFQSDQLSRSFSLLITNSIGNSACAETSPVKITAENQVWPWPQQKVFYIITSFDPDFRYAGFNIVQTKVGITQDTYCKYQFECCKDIIDSLHDHNVSICEDQTYTLPDNTIIKSSGRYYQTLKSKDGCDSVIFYNLKVIKSPRHLVAPIDTCMNDQPSIKLIATGGYEMYLWNSVPSSDSSFDVRQPGSYAVKVENVCGSKTDTVQVYDKCDFPIYFPTAFTPNNDLLNDVLRVPWQNINKLTRLRIYNRYGQVVFSTTRITEGWDGTFKNVPQPVGAYTYILEMKGLSGKKIDQKGKVVLIR
jgi:gliding motility-associated-like protein